MHQRTEAATFDEAFDEEGTPRPHYADLIAALEDCDLEDLTDRVTDQLHHSGVTFGEGAPFRLDPVPRLVTAAGGAEREAGLAPPLRALNAFGDDVYGERRSIAAGVVPEHVLTGIGFLEDDLCRMP